MLFVVDKFCQILDELCPGSERAEGRGDLFELLDGIKTFFWILISKIVDESGHLIFLFHSSILEKI